MNKDTIKYLKGYILQESKIKRYKQMILKNPMLKNEYNKKIMECKNYRNEIERKIEELDDDLLKEVLYNKYVLGKTIEEIALILNYSSRHIVRLHSKATKLIKK